ncbi:hypothetical protein LWF15_30630 [Kineosporia rhizophila]|uniref:DUF6924 domain-containing protein n=1 Tax=Kineosporia TaxID=49184 RepID=UPI001E2D62BC|nr:MULTISPECIES: hypothetical protein [Kineosporia]MCE0539860.1 hypothetical protein [Kineosporia rhizophila]GLY19757.1 hypothetical protein Kisp01_67710 [Kineosporia sp. NBRC 101677]
MDRPAIDVTDHSEFDAFVVVRTDYDRPQAWAAIQQELVPADAAEGHMPIPLLVDDPVWAGAGLQAVIEALAIPAGEEGPSVVLLADSIAMTSDTHQLLAVDIRRLLDPHEDEEPEDDELEEDEDWEEVPYFGRISAARAASMAVNIALANMDFFELIEAEA